MAVETFKRKRHDEELMAQYVARVMAGESATVVSKETNIPYTTIMGRVEWKKKGYEPSGRKRQQTGTPLPEVDEAEILQLMARIQHAGLRVQRRDVLKRANELKDPEAAECGIQWFQRFRDRHPRISGTGTNLVLSGSLMEELLGNLEEEKEEEIQQQKEQEEEEQKEKVMLTPSQRAIQELQNCYSEQLSGEDMVDAFDIMADTVLARVFLVIAPGSLRDMWLKQRIVKVREAENGGNIATSTVI